MWEIKVELGRPQMTIWPTPKSTDTHSEYVITVAFPLQELSHENVSILRTLPVLVLSMSISRVRDLAAPMHLGLINWPFVPHV
jgi:hypothetical protein